MRISEFARLIDRKEKVESEKAYPQIGVRIKGNGAYARDTIRGKDTQYKFFSKVKENDIIVNKIWARNGSVSIVPEELEGCYCSNEYPLYEIDANKVLPEWFYWITKQEWFWRKCEEKSGGTSGKNRIKPKLFLEIEVPIPSIGQQLDFLEKINLVASKKKILDVNQINDDTLVQKLRQAILSEAVQGKLVPQDPNDEPASVLLEKIKAEKEKLIREKKIRKEKPLPPIKDDEIPYELPKGWEWVKLGEVINYDIGGGTPSKNKDEYWNGNIPWTSVKDLNENTFLTKTQDKITELGLKNSSSNLIPKGNIIICTRMGLGKILINKIDAAINQDLRAIFLPSLLEQFYFYYFYKTLSFTHSGTTVSGVRREKLLKIPFPLPPLSEQKRIVAKVDQLMQLCDQLESQVKENQKNSESLMNAVLREAFEVEA